MFATSSDAFIEESKKTPGILPPTQRIGEVEIGQQVYLGVLATGYLPDEDGIAKVKIDIRVLRPDGTVLNETENYSGFLGKPRSPGFVFPMPVMGVTFDSTDPLGRYTVDVVAADLNNGKRATGKVTFELKP